MSDNLDRYDRSIRYLRVSVTDRCNLRCLYCRTVRTFTPLGHKEILSYEEILSVIAAGIQVGIQKVRLTGGEPLLRRGFAEFVAAVCNDLDLKDVGMTTNGVFLKRMVPPLYRSGLRRINVSLDTLQRDRYIAITGRDHLEDVWEGLQEAEAVGFAPVKINVVVMKGINDDEVISFGKITREKPYHVRFIEYMPFGKEKPGVDEKYVSSDRIRSLLETRGPLRKVERWDLDGPAERFRYEGAKGEIGLIRPMSRHMCPSCNRLRLTADGRLRPCLFSNIEFDIKTPVRSGATPRELQGVFLEAIRAKPKQHCIGVDGWFESGRPMSAIGG
jgi:cyclic pyranopterin phosphate synthase